MNSLDDSSTTAIISTISVRRSIRIAKQKKIFYHNMVLSDENKPISKETVRDILKMEISPIRQLKNLTIEARHTLSLQESKKKRLKFENSLFLPNNKKRKDVLKFFDKTSQTLNKTKEKEKTPNTTQLNFKVYNQKPAPILPSYDSDLSSEGSNHSDRSFSMKRNRLTNKEVCNKELVTSENEESTTEKTVYPSYVVYRTKGNKIKLVQNKVERTTPSPNSTIELESQEPPQKLENKSEEPTSITENPESAIKPDEIENPPVPIDDSEEISSEISQGTLIDLSQKARPNENPTVLPSVNVNVSPCLPSNSSNSMEFLTHSTASNESTMLSSDCLEKSNLNSPPFSSKNVLPTEPKEGSLMKALSPKSLIPMAIVGKTEILATQIPTNRSDLIQDTEVQSSTTPRSEEVLVATTNAEDIQIAQPIPNIDNNLKDNSARVSNNQEPSAEHESSQPSLTSANKMKDLPSLKRYFEAISRQRQIANQESTASTSIGEETAEQQPVQSERDDRKMGTQGNTKRKTIPRTTRAHPESSTVQKLVQGALSFEFNPQHYNAHHETINQEPIPPQAENQPSDDYEPLDPLNRMQNIPTFNRYFKPFYLQRPTISGAENSPSTSAACRRSTEQQQPMPAEQSMSAVQYMPVPNTSPSVQSLPAAQSMTALHSMPALQPLPTTARERRRKKPQLPSSSKQETTNMSSHFCQPKTTTVETYGRTVPNPYSPTYSSHISSTQQVFSQHQSPAHAPEPKPISHPSQQSNKPYTRTSSTTRNSPIEIPRPETFPRPTAPPPYSNHTLYSPSYPPQLPGFSPNQHRFPPFPVVQQQQPSNMHSYNAPHYSSSKASQYPQQSPIPKPNMYGGSPPSRNEFGIPPQTNYNYCQPHYSGTQHSSPNQTPTRTENNYGHYASTSRNFAPQPQSPTNVNPEVMRYNTNHQSSFWCQYQHQHQQQQQHHHQYKPQATESQSHPQTSMDQNTVDPNKWLNDRLQQTLRPHENIDKSSWIARPSHQENTVRPPSTSPIDIDTWVRARTHQQAPKPPHTELTTEQRLSQLEAVINSYNKFFNNFEGFPKALVGSATGPSLQAPPPPPQVMSMPSTSQPWQQPMMSNLPSSSPAMGSIPTHQPAPDPRIAWGEYYNQMNTRQFQGNAGYPRSNPVPSENHMRMETNPVNQYPVPQQIISHQINAADSTTGGNPNSSIDMRSYRSSSQHCNQPYPHNTCEPWKNQCHYFKHT
ncbi:uncharacterized protein LOC129951864 [Eupeodes corollae]|uniref:uncharacterized protein LOC129951864 n=1 Tax=Eupeodes corollae TaxID=290404 RepID=UPI0024939D98|nr:uncharacterized protein LOC129951864 [Eupeodes corollae]